MLRADVIDRLVLWSCTGATASAPADTPSGTSSIGVTPCLRMSARNTPIWSGDIPTNANPTRSARL